MQEIVELRYDEYMWKKKMSKEAHIFNTLILAYGPKETTLLTVSMFKESTFYWLIGHSVTVVHLWGGSRTKQAHQMYEADCI